MFLARGVEPSFIEHADSNPALLFFQSPFNAFVLQPRALLRYVLCWLFSLTLYWCSAFNFEVYNDSWHVLFLLFVP